MRLGLLKDIDWELMGALLARDSDVNQVTFIKAFVKECLSWGTSLQVERQLAGVNCKLSPAEIDVLKMISFTE